VQKVIAVLAVMVVMVVPGVVRAAGLVSVDPTGWVLAPAPGKGSDNWKLYWTLNAMIAQHGKPSGCADQDVIAAEPVGNNSPVDACWQLKVYYVEAAQLDADHTSREQMGGFGFQAFDQMANSWVREWADTGGCNPNFGCR
jgi:hypothetical protein